MRIAITGGAGFIGSHLARHLLAEGHLVICLDDLITGNLDNIKPLMSNPHFRFLECNVTHYIDIPDDIDYVLHFASPASPADFDRFPIQIMKAGGVGALHALGMAKAKQARFLLASSSEVYGDPLVSPQREDYWGNVNPVGPRAVYDEAKRFAEALTMAYHRQHGVNTRIARIFNTYGPGMRADDGRVVPNFITQALDRRPLTVYGNGAQTRSFCYVSDLVEGIYRLMRSEIHEPVNLGNPLETTVRELAELVIELTGSRSGILNKPLPQDDPRSRCPDITRARNLLDWEPQVPLREGLSRTIGWFRSQRGQQYAAKPA